VHGVFNTVSQAYLHIYTHRELKHHSTALTETIEGLFTPSSRDTRHTRDSTLSLFTHTHAIPKCTWLVFFRWAHTFL